MSSFGTSIASFNGARYAAPFVKSSNSQNAQAAINTFFGGNSPDVQFMPQSNVTQGPTTAYSTTPEARRWDHVINSFLIMEKMHDHQQFPLLLAPLELALGMRFTTRIFTSNLEPPEEAPEHVPAPFSTTQWTETTTTLKMVHRSVKFSLHELKTDKGQQDYKVHISNLALMFLRDTHNVILRKFANQTTVMEALTSFYPPSKRMHKELMHNVIRSFGMLNTEPAGLDALVSNVKQIGVTQNVDYDTCVVPYGALSNLALSPSNFILTDTAVTLSQNLAKMADINHPAKVPTHVFNNNLQVHQYQKTSAQIQDSRNDPMASQAVVATYHPFGNDEYYLPGSRDIHVVSADSNGWAHVPFEDVFSNLNLPVLQAKVNTLDDGMPYTNEYFFFVKPDGTRKASTCYGHIMSLCNDTACRRIVKNVRNAYSDDKQFAHFVLQSAMQFNTALSDQKTVVEKSLNIVSPGNTFVKINNFDEKDKYILFLFFLLPIDKMNILKQLERGLDFPFDVAIVRPFIELDTAKAVFCKRGRETAVTYCLPPWSFIGRDNRIEMVDMKFGFWRECHIERPANILVAEHAVVTRVLGGMGVKMGCEDDYLADPTNFHAMYDCYPVILGTANTVRDFPSVCAISHRILDESLKQTYASISQEMERYTATTMELNDVWSYATNYAPTLWKGDVINNGAIPRLCCLGTTRQRTVEVSGERPIRSVNKSPFIQNRGHMKKLDSIEWIGSLTGFAQSQIGTPSDFF